MTLDQELMEKGGYSIMVCFICTFVLFVLLIETDESGNDSTLMRIVASFWGAIIVSLLCFMTVSELYGFMAIMNIKLNAIPQVTLIMAIGLTVEFTAHTILAFLNAPHTPGLGWIASRRERTVAALKKMAIPTLHGAMTTTLSIIMLAASSSKFVRLYYFTLYGLLVFFGTFAGLIFLPALLVVFGPTPTRTASVTSDPYGYGNKDTVKRPEIESALEEGY